MSFTLGGHLVKELHFEEHLYGVASAEIVMATAVVLSGRQTLITGDLRRVGTIVDGGVVAGRARYSWLAGAAGWRLPIPARGYGGAPTRAGVIRDAAEACGETVVFTLPDAHLGLVGSPGYVRPLGEAWLVLRGATATESVPWHVRPDGVTQIGERQTLPASTDGTLEESYPEDGRLVIVPRAERIAGYQPGRTLGGAQIVTMRLDAIEDGPIRLTLYTRSTAADVSHDLGAQLARVIDQRTAPARWLGIYEYRVMSRNGTLYAIEPTDPDLGLPRIDNRDLRFGIPGFDAILGRGEQMVYVQFVNGSLAKPFIPGYARRNDVNVPDEVSLDATEVLLGAAVDGTSGKRVARQSDTSTGPDIEFVQAGPSAVSITVTNPAGAGGVSKSAIITVGPGPTLSILTVPAGPTITTKSVLDAPTQDRVYA